MSEQIDWSEAPEGATHYGEALKGRKACWYIIEGRHLYTMLDDGLDKKWGRRAIDDWDASELIPMLISRPTTQSWSGEGLPPDGTVCEYRVCDGPWYKCEIRYTIKHPDGGVIAYCPHLDHEQVLYGPYCCFRPLRTPEQIAADEREAAIDEMMRHSSLRSRDGARQVFGELYDAGYRKP